MRHICEGHLCVLQSLLSHLCSIYLQSSSLPARSQDIKQVTQYARAMVTKFGMSDELGLINYDSGEGDEVFLGSGIVYPAAPVPVGIIDTV